MKKISLLLFGLMSSAAFAHRSCPADLHHQNTFFEQLKHPSEALNYARPRSNSTYANALKLQRRDADRNFLIYLTQKYGLSRRFRQPTGTDRGSFMWTPLGVESEEAIRQRRSQEAELNPPPTEVRVQGKMFSFAIQSGLIIRDESSGKVLLDWPTFNFVPENENIKRDVFARTDRDLMQSIRLNEPDRAFAALKAYLTLNFCDEEERPTLEAEFQSRFKFMTWLDTQIRALESP